jgi:hypothetical protein
MKLLEKEETFLRVRWKASQPDGEVLSLEATLCRHHREEIWHRHYGLMGCGQQGHFCDLCAGRTPARV